jgi:hypothetical protein
VAAPTASEKKRLDKLYKWLDNNWAAISRLRENLELERPEEEDDNETDEKKESIESQEEAAWGRKKVGEAGLAGRATRDLATISDALSRAMTAVAVLGIIAEEGRTNETSPGPISRSGWGPKPDQVSGVPSPTWAFPVRILFVKCFLLFMFTVIVFYSLENVFSFSKVYAKHKVIPGPASRPEYYYLIFCSFVLHFYASSIADRRISMSNFLTAYLV